MPDFDARMNQLLTTLGDLAPGHRERLLRSVRQHDLACWPDSVSNDATSTMKAAMRVAVHQLLDQFCFQLEAVLTRADDDATRVFILALTSIGMADGMRVTFRDGDLTTGVTYSGCETLVIEVLPESRLRVELANSSETPIAFEEISIDSTKTFDDPFAMARDLIDRLKNKGAADQHG
jgi:hypothetical protein